MNRRHKITSGLGIFLTAALVGLTAPQAYRLIRNPEAAGGSVSRALIVFLVLYVGWTIGVLTWSRWLDRERTSSTPPPVVTLRCPACQMRYPYDVLPAHLDEHISASHNPEHTTRPVASIIRNPGDTEWHLIQEEEV